MEGESKMEEQRLKEKRKKKEGDVEKVRRKNNGEVDYKAEWRQLQINITGKNEENVTKGGVLMEGRVGECVDQAEY